MHASSFYKGLLVNAFHHLALAVIILQFFSRCLFFCGLFTNLYSRGSGFSRSHFCACFIYASPHSFWYKFSCDKSVEGKPKSKQSGGHCWNGLLEIKKNHFVEVRDSWWAKLQDSLKYDCYKFSSSNNTKAWTGKKRKERIRYCRSYCLVIFRFACETRARKWLRLNHRVHVADFRTKQQHRKLFGLDGKARKSIKFHFDNMMGKLVFLLFYIFR